MLWVLLIYPNFLFFCCRFSFSPFGFSHIIQCNISAKRVGCTNVCKWTTAISIWSFQFPTTVIMSKPFVVLFGISNEEMNLCSSIYWSTFYNHLQTTRGWIHLHKWCESQWETFMLILCLFLGLSLISLSLSVGPIFECMLVVAKNWDYSLRIYWIGSMKNNRSDSNLWRSVCVFSPDTIKPRGIYCPFVPQYLDFAPCHASPVWTSP